MKSEKPTCEQCSTQYNQIYREKIIKQLSNETMIADETTTKDICLDCIITNLKISAESCLPNLIKAIAIYKRLDVATKKAQYKKDSLAREHTLFDQQYHYIKFFIKQEEARIKEVLANKTKSTTKKKSPTTKSIIAALMAKLTPEQQKAVAAKAKSLLKS